MTYGANFGIKILNNPRGNYQLSSGAHSITAPLYLCGVSANNFVNTSRGLCEVKFAICQDPGVDSIMYLGD